MADAEIKFTGDNQELTKALEKAEKEFKKLSKLVEINSKELKENTKLTDQQRKAKDIHTKTLIKEANAQATLIQALRKERDERKKNTQAVEKNTEATKKNTKEVNASVKAAKLADDAFDQWADSVGEQTQASKKNTQAGEAQSKQASKSTRESKKQAKAVKEVSDNQKILEGISRTLTGTFGKLGKSLTSVTALFARFGKIGAVTTALAAMTSGATKLATALAVLGARLRIVTIYYRDLTKQEAKDFPLQFSNFNGNPDNPNTRAALDIKKLKTASRGLVQNAELYQAGILAKHLGLAIDDVAVVIRRFVDQAIIANERDINALFASRFGGSLQSQDLNIFEEIATGGTGDDPTGGLPRYLGLTTSQGEREFIRTEGIKAILKKQTGREPTQKEVYRASLAKLADRIRDAQKEAEVEVTNSFVAVQKVQTEFFQLITEIGLAMDPIIYLFSTVLVDYLNALRYRLAAYQPIITAIHFLANKFFGYGAKNNNTNIPTPQETYQQGSQNFTPNYTSYANTDSISTISPYDALATQKSYGENIRKPGKSRLFKRDAGQLYVNKEIGKRLRELENAGVNRDPKELIQFVAQNIKAQSPLFDALTPDFIKLINKYRNIYQKLEEGYDIDVSSGKIAKEKASYDPFTVSGTEEIFDKMLQKIKLPKINTGIRAHLLQNDDLLEIERIFKDKLSELLIDIKIQNDAIERGPSFGTDGAKLEQLSQQKTDRLFEKMLRKLDEENAILSPEYYERKKKGGYYTQKGQKLKEDQQEQYFQDLTDKLIQEDIAQAQEELNQKRREEQEAVRMLISTLDAIHPLFGRTAKGLYTVATSIQLLANPATGAISKVSASLGIVGAVASIGIPIFQSLSKAFQWGISEAEKLRQHEMLLAEERKRAADAIQGHYNQIARQISFEKLIGNKGFDSVANFLTKIFEGGPGSQGDKIRRLIFPHDSRATRVDELAALERDHPETLNRYLLDAYNRASSEMQPIIRTITEEIFRIRKSIAQAEIEARREQAKIIIKEIERQRREVLDKVKNAEEAQRAATTRAVEVYFDAREAEIRGAFQETFLRAGGSPSAREVTREALFQQIENLRGDEGARLTKELNKITQQANVSRDNANEYFDALLRGVEKAINDTSTDFDTALSTHVTAELQALNTKAADFKTELAKFAPNFATLWETKIQPGINEYMRDNVVGPLLLGLGILGRGIVDGLTPGAGDAPDPGAGSGGAVSGTSTTLTIIELTDPQDVVASMNALKNAIASMPTSIKLTAEGVEFSSLKTAISDAITNHETFSKLKGTLGNIDTDLTNINTSIGTLNTALTTIDSTLTNLPTNISSSVGALTFPTPQVTFNQGDIDIDVTVHRDDTTSENIDRKPDEIVTSNETPTDRRGNPWSSGALSERFRQNLFRTLRAANPGKSDFEIWSMINPAKFPWGN